MRRGARGARSSARRAWHPRAARAAAPMPGRAPAQRGWAPRQQGASWCRGTVIRGRRTKRRWRRASGTHTLWSRALWRAPRLARSAARRRARCRQPRQRRRQRRRRRKTRAQLVAAHAAARAVAKSTELLAKTAGPCSRAQRCGSGRGSERGSSSRTGSARRRGAQSPRSGTRRRAPSPECAPLSRKAAATSHSVRTLTTERSC